MMFWEFWNYVLRIRTKISSPDNHATLLIIGRKSQSKLQNIFHELYIDIVFRCLHQFIDYNIDRYWAG